MTSQSPTHDHSRLGGIGLSVAYGLMICAALAVFLGISSYGENLLTPASVEQEAAAGAAAIPRADVLLHVLVALTAVVIVGRLLAKLFAYLGQPPVIGEVIAGILLGPSLLGRVAPEVSAFLLPPTIAPSLGVIAQLGVVLYMFLVGLELNAGLLRGRAHSTVAVSHASIIVPFLLGATLAIALYPRLSSGHVSFTSFALFMGVAMSITAFPVLARILTDRKLAATELGVVALTCAAVDDVTAWCLLALLVGVAQAKIGSALGVVVLTLAYVTLMFLVVRPVVSRLVARANDQRLDRGVFALVLAGLLLSALTTEMIGVHAIFGAFLFGAVIPHDSGVARMMTRKLEDLVTVLLLPAFFAFTGMRTEIGLVSGLQDWLICGAIIVVATVGKFAGTFFPARLTGLSQRHALGLSILMNTRGLMELVVLNIGLDLNVISPRLFAMMVLMALVTTMATSPLLQLLTARGTRAAPATEPAMPT